MNLDALAGMDPAAMQKMMEEAMADPALRQQMESMNANVADAMEQLAKMSPEELQAQMMEGLQQLTSGNIMDSVMGKKDEVLETLAAQGLVPADKIEEYRSNPEKVCLDLGRDRMHCISFAKPYRFGLLVCSSSSNNPTSFAHPFPTTHSLRKK